MPDDDAKRKAQIVTPDAAAALYFGDVMHASKATRPLQLPCDKAC